jgi:glycosyltransferase involved in cell wall biosynthesis
MRLSWRLRGNGSRPARTPRVVIAARLFPPEPAAAAYRLGALAAALSDRGAPVTVLSTRPPRGVGSTWSRDGVRVRRWPVLRDAAGAVRGYVQFASFDGPLLLRLLATRAPDVVVVEPPPTTGTVVRLVCALRRVPYVYYAADISSTAAEGIGVPAPVVRVLRTVERWVMRGAAHVLAVSPGVAAEVQRLGVSADRLTMVGTGVDTDQFSPGDPDDASDSSAKAERTFVYAGTMSEIQGVEVFVRAFAALARERDDVGLVMLGGGAETPALRQMAELLCPGRVRFEGLVSADRVAAELRAACAGLASVRPSRGYDFAFATKMFVSTACGTPVVYAGVGPGRQLVVEHDLGWAADWDVDAVAEAMRLALASPAAPDRGARLAAWTRANASLALVGVRAADRVLAQAKER